MVRAGSRRRLSTRAGARDAGHAEKGFRLCPEPRLRHALLAATTDTVLAGRHRLERPYDVMEFEVMVTGHRSPHRCRLHGVETRQSTDGIARRERSCRAVPPPATGGAHASRSRTSRPRLPSVLHATRGHLQPCLLTHGLKARQGRVPPLVSGRAEGYAAHSPGRARQNWSRRYESKVRDNHESLRAL